MGKCFNLRKKIRHRQYSIYFHSGVLLKNSAVAEILLRGIKQSLRFIVLSRGNTIMHVFLPIPMLCWLTLVFKILGPGVV